MKKRLWLSIALGAVALFSTVALVLVWINRQPGREDNPTDPLLPTHTSPGGTVLSYSQFGRYSGAYVEDGSDTPIEDVAAILVKNPTPDFLEYARIEFDIGGQKAVFVLRGLPPGAAAWVLEANKLIIEPGSVFSLKDEVTSFGSPGISGDGIKLSGDTGVITALNETEANIHNVYIYYRQRHTDGNYLGGICYRVSLGNLAPGEPVTVTAGHFNPENSKIVKITCEKESS